MHILSSNTAHNDSGSAIAKQSQSKLETRVNRCESANRDLVNPVLNVECITIPKETCFRDLSPASPDVALSHTKPSEIKRKAISTYLTFMSKSAHTNLNMAKHGAKCETIVQVASVTSVTSSTFKNHLSNIAIGITFLACVAVTVLANGARWEAAVHPKVKTRIAFQTSARLPRSVSVTALAHVLEPSC